MVNASTTLALNEVEVTDRQHPGVDKIHGERRTEASITIW